MIDNGIYIGYQNKIAEDIKTSIERYFIEFFGECRVSFVSLDSEEIIRVIPSNKRNINLSDIDAITATLKSLNLKSVSVAIF